MVVLTGEQGFLRGTLRALARERKRRGFGPEQPFELIGRTDGRLTLIDPRPASASTSSPSDPTNAGVFARLLTRQRPSRRAKGAPMR